MFEVVKKKIRLISTLVTTEELKDVLSLTVVEPPRDARYKIGDILHVEGLGNPLNLKVYGVKSGGYGFAYVVLDQETLTPYCLKTFRDRFLDPSRRIEQLKREGETWVRLGKHENIVYAHSVLNIRGRPHILLEYVAGSDLWRRIKQGAIPVSRTLRYAIQFCRGMGHAQKTLPGFVHGDIKPNNCLLTRDDTLKIGDFGQVNIQGRQSELSKRTFGLSSEVLNSPTSRWRAGTPAYMAPEQFDASTSIDTRSDVYAFGVMLFEMLTGARPFTGRKHKECFAQHRNAIPSHPTSLNAQIPKPLANLILSCLEKSPAERPRDFNFLEGELRSLLWDLYRKRVPDPVPSEFTDAETINRGLSWVVLDRKDEALACFDAVLNGKPELARAWSHKGNVLSEAGCYDQALACFDRALALDSKLAFAWGNKGKTLDGLRRYDEAVICFDRALGLDSRLALVWANKGMTLANVGRFRESLVCFKRAIAIDPRDPDFLIKRGVLFNRLGRYQEAFDTFKQAISINPQPEAHCNLGDTYFCLGQVKAAIESYRQAIRLKPDHQPARRGLERAYREFCSGDKLLENSDIDYLIAFLTEDPETEPKSVVRTGVIFLKLANLSSKMLYLVGDRIYGALENIDPPQKEELIEALGRVRESNKTTGQDRESSYCLGRIYYGLNLYEECVEVFQRSIALFGRDDKALYYLAACNEIRGNYEEALDYYQQALIFDPFCSLTISGVNRVETTLTSQKLAADHPNFVCQ